MRFVHPVPFLGMTWEGDLTRHVFTPDDTPSCERAVIPHDTFIDDTNVDELGKFDTVFLCMDGHPIKADIIETCVANNKLLIDVGMGLHRVGDSLAGTLRTTTLVAERHDHAEHCVDLAGDGAGDEYERNPQLAELNALNAALAVSQMEEESRLLQRSRG